MNLQALRIDFAKACASYDYSLHTGRPWCSDTTEEATKTLSLFPYHKVCSNSHRWSPGLYGRTRGKHPNSQTTIWSTHIVPCKKCKLNPCLKTDNLLLLLALQPPVGLWPVKQSPSVFPYLSPILLIFSLPSLSTSSLHTLMGKTENTFSKNFISIKC